MVGYLQPLAHNFAIVNELGYPTEYFIRWAQQKQIDIEESVGEARALEIVKTFLTEHPIQAGSGIDLTPDGDLNNSPTISAKAQEILDQITTARGSILFRGASGWETLPPGTATQYLKSGGPSADPLWGTPAGGGGGGRTTPVMKQFGTLRNDGTLSLPNPPVVGNLLVVVTAGFFSSLGSYAPTGMSRIGQYQSNANNGVMCWAKGVVAGDTGSYSISAPDNQAAVIYEFEDALSVWPMSGGYPTFSGTSFNFDTVPNLLQTPTVLLVPFTHDTVATLSFTSSNIIQDYTTPSGLNHTGVFGRMLASEGWEGVTGTGTGTITQPCFGLFGVVGLET